MNDNAIWKELGDQLGLSLAEGQSFDWLRTRLAERINTMIQTDFEELVRILYRVDVNENKLKYLLREKVGEDAAYIIADLLIERQLQKKASREQFQQPPPDDDEERW